MRFLFFTLALFASSQAGAAQFQCLFEEFCSSDQTECESASLEISFSVDKGNLQASVIGKGFLEAASVYLGPTALSLIQPIYSTGAVQTLTVYDDNSAVYLRASSFSVGGGFSMTWLGTCEVPEGFW